MMFVLLILMVRANSPHAFAQPISRCRAASVCVVRAADLPNQDILYPGSCLESCKVEEISITSTMELNAFFGLVEGVW